MYLRKLLKTLACGAMMLGGGSSAWAASATAPSQAVLVAPLSFFVVDELDFGRILAGATAGTVVIAPSGARTSTGGVTLINSPTAQPVNFAGRGRQNQIVAISLATTPNRLTRIGGTQTMVLDTFVIGSTPTAPITTAPTQFRIAGPGGVFNFPLGATLRVGANQTPGNYAGTFVITLNYL
ncbi:MAG: DUF4402 domain-containing protein [Sphingomonadaceae bacterium]